MLEIYTIALFTFGPFVSSARIANKMKFDFLTLKFLNDILVKRKVLTILKLKLDCYAYKFSSISNLSG